MAALFGITVDELLTSHDAWVPKPTLRSEKETYSQLFIVLCTIASIWTLCVVEFVLVWIFLDTIQWITFVAAVPLSLVALLVFNSVWYAGKQNMYIIGLLVMSIVALVYLLLLNYNFWQMFLVLVPAEIVVYLACNIKKKNKSPDSTGSRARKSGRRARENDSSL